MLIGENLILRPLKRSDSEVVKKWRNDLETIKMAQLIRFPKTDEMDKEWWDHVLTDKSNRNIYFAVTIKSSQNIIGIIQLTNIDWISGTAVWGLIIGDKSNQGKGYGTEAARILFDYAFNVLNLRKIFGYPIEFNKSTLRMHKKIGQFSEEGRLKKHVYFENKYYDVLIISIFKEEYLRNQIPDKKRNKKQI